MIDMFDVGDIKTPGGMRWFLESGAKPSEKQEARVQDVASIKVQEALEKQAAEIQAQRIQEALTNFPAKDGWVSQHLGERKRIRKLMNKPLTQEELDEYQQDIDQRYPETQEARLDYINSHKSDYLADIDTIVKELKQWKS